MYCLCCTVAVIFKRKVQRALLTHNHGIKMKSRSPTGNCRTIPFHHRIETARVSRLDGTVRRLPMKKRKIRSDMVVLSSATSVAKRPAPSLKRIRMETSNILGTVTTTNNKDLATRGGPVLQCIFRDLVNRVSTTPDNAQRKKLLNERKHFWRKELGLTKVDFSGVWILARNKYNVVMQYQATRVSNCSALVMPTSDTGPSRVNKADALKQKKKGNSKASNKLRNKKRGPNLNRWSNLCRTGRTRSLEIYRFGDWDFFTPSKI
jgi:hypothetical protein